jgi:hypothetical protein
VTVDDVRQLMGASTPHFALQLRERIRALIRELPGDHPARIEGEREIARLDRLLNRLRAPCARPQRPSQRSSSTLCPPTAAKSAFTISRAREVVTQ